MPPKKGPATPRGNAKKKASPTHRTGPWVIGGRETKTAPTAEPAPSSLAPPTPGIAPPEDKKLAGPSYDPDFLAISTPPPSRRSSPARSPKQLRGVGHLDDSAYDYHRLVRATLVATPLPTPGHAPPEGVTAELISEDAKARATTPQRTTATYYHPDLGCYLIHLGLDGRAAGGA